MKQGVLWLILGITGAAMSCVLPDYQKVGRAPGNTKVSDAGPDAEGSGDGTALSGASADCKSCMAQNCSDAMAECGSDCEKLTLPISPASVAPKTGDGFFQCMQDHCDSSCDLTWGCVGRYHWPTPSQAYNVTLRVIDIAASSPLNQVQVTACQASDPSCSPSSGLLGAGTTDVGGHATFGVPKDFTGFFLFTAGDEYMPATSLWTQPAYALTEGFTQRMLPWAVADGLAAGTETKLRREASHLIFRAQNCLPLHYLGGTMLHAEADDVSVTYTPPLEDSSKVFYTGVNGNVDPTLIGTTSAGSSFGGAFNLPTRLVTVIASHAGKEVSRAAIQMRPGTVGFVYLVPNSR